MSFDTIVNSVKNIIDVLLVWLVTYYILKSLSKNVKMALLFKGIIFILILKILSDLFNLVTIGFLLDYVIEWGILALIVIFQPEIRNVLEHLGRSQLLGRHKVLTVDERERIVYEIVSTMDSLRKTRTGALIVIERDIQIKDIISTGIPMNSEVSPQLLVNIFVPKTPLHDGAVVISNNKIAAAACMLPLASDKDIAKELGTRHRAGIGISKESDSIAIIVSEETGKVSVAKDGTLIADVREDVLKKILISNIVTKRLTEAKEKTERKPIKETVKNIFKKKEEK